MNYKKTKTIFLLATSVLVLGSCSKNKGSGSELSSSSLGSATVSQVRLSMKILDGGTEVYNDARSTSLLALKANKPYSLVLTPSSEVAGLNYKVTLTKTSAVGSVPQVTTMYSGSNNFTVSSQGDYALKVVASAPQMLPLTKNYTAAVSCASPTFTANTLNPNAISATPSGSNNLFNVSASGITAGANGQAPYTCAFDPTGSGIVDTAPVDCSTGIQNFYNNYVSQRNVSVIVKDACNTVYTVSKVVDMPFSVPAMGAGNVFIYGQVSSATGSAVGDSRVDGVTYLATNQNPGHNIVQPSYSGSSFTIKAAQNYGMASSVPFGMSIDIQGIGGSIDVVAGTGSLNMTNASIRSLTYSTDQAGDSRTSVSFSQGSCTLDNTGIRVQFMAGTPCTSGTGSGRMASVEVWGSYSCTNLQNSTASGSIRIDGQFSGVATLIDSCSGTGVGGGITPVNL